MKHTFATMLLAALFCAVAAQGIAQGEQPYVYYGNTDGGTVKFYGAKPTSNSTPEEITQAEPGSTVYVVPVPDDFHTTEGLQLQAVKTADSNVAEIPRRGVGYAQDIEIVTDVAGSLYHFTMPAGGADVRVSATFGKRTQKVIYLDPTKPADQQECEVEAYILDKPVSKLPGSGEEGTWYVCTTPATENEGKGLVIEGPLKLFSKVNLILADGCKMTVSAVNDYAIDGATSANGNLTIYAQSTGSDMGQLVATSSVNPEPTDGPNPSNHGNYAICLYNLTINGGAITATGPLRGIFCNVISSNTVLSINGGRVSAKGTGDGSYGIESADKMSITGGQVTATGQAGGINVGYGDLDITLSSADDFVEASGYYFVGVPERHVLHLGAVGTDGSGCYLASTPGTGVLTPFAYVAGGITLSAEQQAAVAGKRIALASKGLEYVDANGKLQNISTDTYSGDSDTPQHYTEDDFTYVLTGGEQEIGTDGKTTWYVCDSEVAYTSKINLLGDVRLILADGATMTIGSSTTPATDNGLYNSEGSISIYGQSEKTGKLTVFAEENAIYAADNDLTIIGCEVEAIGSSDDGISAKVISLTGAKVTASGATSGINATDGDLTINGGTVNATATGSDGYGLYAKTNLTVGVDENNTAAKVTATGKGSNSAIYAESGNVSLTNADITAMAENAYAINAYSGTLTIEGGKVNATAEATETGHGIYASGDIQITGNCELKAFNGDHGIYSENGGLTIDGSTVTATSVDGNGLNANGKIEIKNSESVEGMKVTASGQYGILSGGDNSDVTITGGEVEAIGSSDDGISAKVISLTGAKVSASGATSGIYATDGDLTINGGTVNATATGENGNGLYANGNINISWTDKTNDFITASSYDGTIVVADGQHFRATKNENDTETTVTIIDGTVNDTDVLASLAGSTLKPLEGIVVSTDDAKVTLSGDPTHYAGENGIHYYIYEASAANTEILLGYGDIDAGKSVTYALTKTGTDIKVGLIASYMNGKRELVNRQGKDASFTLPVPAHDVTIATNINPFLQPGGYCGNVVYNTSVTPIEITADYSKNVWWIVSDIDNVRTVTIVRGEDENNDIINGGVGTPWKAYDATVAVIPSGMTDIGKLGLLEQGSLDDVKLILVDNMDVYKDYIQNGGDIDDSQKNKFAPKTFDITVPKGWGTYCQSYPVGYSLSTGATPYTISDIENNAVSVAAAASVAPYTPVLINNTNETGKVTLTAVPSTAGDGAGSSFLGKQEGTGYNFYGNPYDVVLTNDDIKLCENDENNESVDYVYAIGASDAYQSYGLYNGEFYAVDDASAGIAGHKCWLNVAKPTQHLAPRLSITMDGETTEIGDAMRLNDKRQMINDKWYTLDGRKINGQPTKKGIYIYNGRKVVIK